MILSQIQDHLLMMTVVDNSLQELASNVIYLRIHRKYRDTEAHTLFRWETPLSSQLKNFQNQSTFTELMTKNQVVCFFKHDLYNLLTIEQSYSLTVTALLSAEW